MSVRNALHFLLVGALVACAGHMAAQSTASFSLDVTSAAAVTATEGASGYNQPPKNILDVMHAPSPPVPRVSPTQDAILLVSWQDYPSIGRVSTPFLRLAGVRVEPKNHSKHDTPGGYGITPCARSFELVHVTDASQIPIALPEGACPGAPMWAADGKRFAFVNLAPDAVELWIGDSKTGKIHKVPSVRLNPMFNDEMQWMPDQKTLLVKLVPEGMGAPPPEPVVPAGPSIQETTGEKGESSTYENRDTLRNRHDEDVFDYYAASQLALVDAATGAITPVGKPGNYESGCCGAGWAAHTRGRDSQTLFLRDHLRSFPARSRSLGHIRSRTRSGSYHRVASAGRSRSHRRGSGRSARFFLACHRAGDAGLGRSAGWRRLES